MATIRVDLPEAFLLGDDVVLLTMDGDGVVLVLDTLRDAVRQGSSQRRLDGVAHTFVIEAGAARVEFGDDRVVWSFDRTMADEVIEALDALRRSDRPGHFYVDLSAPVDTLVFSRDEYVG